MNLEADGGAPARAGGAWHHLADGGPAAEMAALLELLDGVAVHARKEQMKLLGSVNRLDDGTGLPESFTHPDFVLRNFVATPSDELVLVNWPARVRRRACGRLSSCCGRSASAGRPGACRARRQGLP
jgi:hypothetical protein